MILLKPHAFFDTLLHYSHSTYIHGANDVRQTAIHVAEPIVLLILRWLLNSWNIMSLQQERFKQ